MINVKFPVSGSMACGFIHSSCWAQSCGVVPGKKLVRTYSQLWYSTIRLICIAPSCCCSMYPSSPWLVLMTCIVGAYHSTEMMVASLENAATAREAAYGVVYGGFREIDPTRDIL